MRTLIRAASATVVLSVVAMAGGCGGSGPSGYLIAPLASGTASTTAPAAA